MATASKILIRLQKFSFKISAVVDATDSFNANNSFYQDLSGWDLAVVQVVNPGTTIYFKTTNDDGSVTGDLLPAPEVPLYWMPVLGVDLSTKSDVSSISGTGLVSFGIIGKYLQLIAAGATTTTTTTAAPTTTTTSTTSTTTTTTAAPTTTTTSTTTSTTTTIAPTGDFITTEGSDPIITEDDNNLITE
jgi:hypothetical protein